MALPKLYEQTVWHNNTSPALNEDNLNSMSQAINDIDDRVIELAGTIMEDVPEIREDLEILGPAVEQINTNVARAETAADNAETEALKSEGYAVGKQDGVEVTSGEYYENNAKYYAEIANPPIENTVGFTDIITISDAINKAAKDVRLKVEAVQDLHGYDKPWVGGAGKNILPLTIANLKAVNTGGTWSGNNYTYQGMTFACQVNDDGAVTGIKVTGTNGGSPTVLGLNLSITTNSEMILNGCPSGGGASNYQLDLNSGVYADQGSGATVPSGTTLTGWRLRIGANYAAPSEGLWFYPMIRKSTESAAFESYTNICPVSGWDNAKVTRSGKNLLPNNATTQTVNGVTFTVNGDGTITANGTASANTWLTFGTFKGKKGTGYILSGCPSGGSRNTFNIVYYQSPNYFDLGNGVSFIGDGAVHDATIYIASGQTLSNAVFKPMISVEGGEFEPYKETKEITISLNGTRYGCTHDVTSGVLTPTHGFKALDGSEGISWYVYNSENYQTVYANITSKLTNPKTTGREEATVIFNAFETRTSNSVQIKAGRAWVDANNGGAWLNMAFPPNTFVDSAAFNTWLASNNVQFTYELATPQTIQLTAEEIDLLYGYNTLFGDCGDISLTYDASGIIHIDEAKLDTETLKTIAAASSDFADFKARIAAL